MGSETNEMCSGCVLVRVRTLVISLCGAGQREESQNSCLIGFATKKDLRCGAIIIIVLDGLTPTVSHD